MRISSQKGLAHAGVVAAVVVVIAVAGVGYFVSQRDGETKTNSGTSSTSIPAENSTAKDEKAAKAAASAHFALVHQQKYEEAYQSTCKEFRELSTYSAFQEYVGTTGFKTIDLSKVDYSTADIRNDQAKISGSVGPLSPDDTLSVSLLKKNGQWCVYGYQIQ